MNVASDNAARTAAPVEALKKSEPLLEIQQALGEALYAKRRDHDPCPCGSGGKYKRCHGRQWQALLGD